LDDGAGVVQRGVRVGVALLLATVTLQATSAVADEVTSKGTVLHGKVTAISTAGITFEPEYGKGSLAIKWADIENLKTDGPFQVLFAEGDESDQPIHVFSDAKLLVTTAAVARTEIDVATIHSGVPLGPGGPTFLDRTRSFWRYWDGSFDVGFNLQQATTDTKGLLVAFQTVRTKDPTKFTLLASYRYGT